MVTIGKRAEESLTEGRVIHYMASVARQIGCSPFSYRWAALVVSVPLRPNSIFSESQWIPLDQSRRSLAEIARICAWPGGLIPTSLAPIVDHQVRS